MTKGETPIEKNIMVVDEKGNKYEATWPRRAKGLVKSGRARFISDNKICLACPPDFNLEDNNMSYENREEINGQEFVKEKQDREDGRQETPQEQKVDTLYLIRQIEKVLNQTDYLHQAMDNLAKMSDGENGEAYAAGNILGEAKANAFKEIVCYRETTNQQVLRMYEKMYDDLQGKRTFEQELLDYLKAPEIRSEEKLRHMQCIKDIIYASNEGREKED